MPDAAMPTIDPAAIDAIIHARHGDPFAVLGPHDGTVRVFLPGVSGIDVVDSRTNEVTGVLQKLHPAGFWSGPLGTTNAYHLRVSQGELSYDMQDPYRFPPILGDVDIHLLAEGRHLDIGRALGAHPFAMQGVSGVRFAVWAPNARRVSVVGDFNGWDGRRHPMRLRMGPGVWEMFVPGLAAGALYKFEIAGPDGSVLPLKADPMAWAAQVPPQTASIVVDDSNFVWTDHAWMQERAGRHTPQSAMSIYEVHAGSWSPAAHMGVDGWDALAASLVPYVASMGFTHIELMPIMEHPFGGSWGYQPLGQFAPSSRLGPPDAFARFVDRCHVAGIGVILDWVPAHFPTDAYGLARFDGTALYEHDDPREGFHRDWNTLIYNLGRNEVRAFLIGSALFWLEQYHCDGIRVDAVASMLYRDYSRNAGEWIPNQYGGRENLESVAFLQELSRAVTTRAPGALLIAEESTAWPGVTRPADEGGLGFDYKWNMGWMHDTLHYIEEDPINRRYHHGEMTFGLVYAFSEKFVLPISHDEVVYGKGSLLGKMPGDDWQRFANMRAYLGFMWTHPGKKLLFMGSEFAQPAEWNHDHGLDWWLLDHAPHRGVQSLVRDLNAVYRTHPALYQRDDEPGGFRWVVIDDVAQSVFVFLRLGLGDTPPVLVVCNFTPVPRYDYRVGVTAPGFWREVLNSDATVYGGSGLGNFGGLTAQDEPLHGLPASLALTVPPLATIVFALDTSRGSE